MRLLFYLLITWSSLFHLRITACSGILGLRSPVNMVNILFDSLLDSFDLRNKSEDVRIVSALQNASRTRFKMLLEIYDTKTGAVNNYIGAQTRLINTDKGMQHKIMQYVQSENVMDVTYVLKLSFNDAGSFNCDDLKSDFIDYYLYNTNTIQWFTRYFKIESNMTAARSVGSQTETENENTPKEANQAKNEKAQEAGNKNFYYNLMMQNPGLVPNSELLDERSTAISNLVNILSKQNTYSNTNQSNEKKSSSGLTESNKNIKKSLSEYDSGDLSKLNQVLKADQEKLNELNDILGELKIQSLDELKSLIQNQKLDNTTDNRSVEAQNYQQQLSSLRYELESKYNEIEELKKQNKDELRKLKEVHALELEEMREKSKQALKEVRDTLDEQIEQMRTESEKELEKVNARHKQEINRLISQKKVETEDIKEARKAEYDALINEKVLELENKLKSTRAELLRIQEDKEKAILAVEKEKEKELIKLEKQKEEKLKSINEQKSKEIEILLNEKEEELRLIQAQKEKELQTEIENRTKDLEALIKQKDEDLARAIKQKNKLMQQLKIQRKEEEKNLTSAHQRTEKVLSQQQRYKAIELEEDIKDKIKSQKESKSDEDDVISNVKDSDDSSTFSNNNFSTNNDAFYLNTINNMRNRLTMNMQNTALNTTNPKEILRRHDRVINDFINGLSTEQRKLIEDYLEELAIMFNSEPISIYSLDYDKILLILDQIRIQQQKKKLKYERMRNQLLQEYLDRMNRISSFSNANSPFQSNFSINRSNEPYRDDNERLLVAIDRLEYSAKNNVDGQDIGSAIAKPNITQQAISHGIKKRSLLDNSYNIYG